LLIMRYQIPFFFWTLLGIIGSSHSQLMIFGAAYGNGLYAFVEPDYILTTASLDSSDWTSTQVVSNHGKVISGITYDDAYGFVAVSSDYTYISENGTSWKSSPINNNDCSSAFPYGGPIISYKGILIMTNQNGGGSSNTNYCYSTDAKNWNYVSNTGEYFSMITTELGFLKTGYGTNFSISTDGVHWDSSSPFPKSYNYSIGIAATSTDNTPIACLVGEEIGIFLYSSESNSWNLQSTVVQQYSFEAFIAVSDKFLLSMIPIDDDDEIVESINGGNTWIPGVLQSFGEAELPFTVNGYAILFSMSGNYVNYSSDGVIWNYEYVNNN